MSSTTQTVVQIFWWCLKYNERFFFLVVFKISLDRSQESTPLCQFEPLPVFVNKAFIRTWPYPFIYISSLCLP